MPPIITFIGWHDSGKTTIAAKVLAALRQRGLRVAAIKSTHKTGIVFDQAATDTGRYKEAGADGVLLAAPDQIVLQIPGDNVSLLLALPPTLPHLAERFFPDHDLVIAEGFKRATGVAKIEVRRDGEPLAGGVDGVVAVVANESGNAGHGHVFRPDQVDELGDFIQEKIIAPDKRLGIEQAARPAQTARVSLTIGGQPLPLKAWVQEALAGTVLGFVAALKKPEGMGAEEVEEVVLRIRSRKP